MKQWEAVVFSHCLISLMYIVSFMLKIVSIRSSWAEHGDRQTDISFPDLKSGFKTSSTGWFRCLQ
ncbi:hypothetical protein Hanom_Chr16g01474511 [Helianthus anomalus]